MIIIPRPIAWRCDPLRFRGWRGFPTTRVVSDDKALEVLGSEDFKPRRQLIVASPPSFAAQPGEAKSVSLRGQSPNRITVDLTTSKPGWLFLNDSFHPGWAAFIDGNPERVVPANYAFMATAVPAGRHEGGVSVRANVLSMGRPADLPRPGTLIRPLPAFSGCSRRCLSTFQLKRSRVPPLVRLVSVHPLPFQLKSR